MKYTVNHTHIQRLASQNDLLRPQKTRKTRTTNSQHPYPRYENLVKDLNITHPEQVGVIDITYIRLKKNFVYLAIIMDVYTRSVQDWQEVCLSTAEWVCERDRLIFSPHLLHKIPVHHFKGRAPENMVIIT